MKTLQDQGLLGESPLEAAQRSHAEDLRKAVMGAKKTMGKGGKGKAGGKLPGGGVYAGQAPMNEQATPSAKDFDSAKEFIRAFNVQEAKDSWWGLSEAAVAYRRALRGEEIDNFRKKHQELIDMTKLAKAEVISLGVDALGQLAAGMWNAADAAIQGRQSFASSMLSITKSVLLGVAQQATVKAIFETAEGFAALAKAWGFPTPESTLHFTSAAIFGGIAAATGLGGLGISAATGGGGRGTGAGAGRQTSSRSANPSSPSIGKRPQDQDMIIQITNYYSDPSNRSAVLTQYRKIETDVRVSER
jgi:hypothetical protein